jgi:hypothetical protein
LNNVVDFGVLDTDGLLFSAILKTSNIRYKVMGLCVVNNVQTSPASPYPSGYCDYRVYGSVTDKGMLGGGCGESGDYGVHYTSSGLSTNTDYLFEMEFKNSQLTGRITQTSNSTVVYEQTITPPKDYSNYHFALFLFSDITVTYSNVKVKPL